MVLTEAWTMDQQGKHIRALTKELEHLSPWVAQLENDIQMLKKRIPIR